MVDRVSQPTWEERARTRRALLSIVDAAVEHYSALKKGEREPQSALFTREERPDAE